MQTALSLYMIYSSIMLNPSTSQMVSWLGYSFSAPSSFSVFCVVKNTSLYTERPRGHTVDESDNAFFECPLLVYKAWAVVFIH